ncbi:hypothetical protein GWI33_019044 [Rhynchophorus ferrugineus]|uniref:Uncharacterized protein n=1 Tax=Rhynchophorus ferrugineus TaxID=354439 RepID=A0A834I657_RHYFE|nr:hypothetical protein GWI33_019044 [Rhynchophorus ferrugineus]
MHIFESKLNKAEKRAWVAFMKVCHNFLGNTKSDNYRQIIKELLSAYKDIRCNMLLKINFLDWQLDFFPENLGAVSDEDRKKFHQYIMQIESRYNGKWSAAMFPDFCWSIRRETPMEIMKRKKATK